MIAPLIRFRSRLALKKKAAFDASRILTSAIRGFVSTMTIAPSLTPIRATRTNYPSSLTLVSRLSCRRAGTRFNSRGIDDEGHVANFVETECVFWFPSGLCFSYVQVRGSVPIFWEQATGLLPNQQKISITRSPQATQPAFDKHFEDLEMSYGAVFILNLLSKSKLGEVELTDRYRYHVLHNPFYQDAGKGVVAGHSLLQELQFDFHAETKGPSGYEAASMVRRLIQDSAEGFAYHLSENTQDSDRPQLGSDDLPRQKSVSVLEQNGVFRTNCLDCLDRTNLIQTIIDQMALEDFLRHRSERALPEFWMRHSTLWADNGDALSKIYAGTGALKSSFTRHGKMSLSGAFADARKSATRLIINNFADKGRQSTIDLLLGRLVDQSPVQLYDPISDYVTAELGRRIHDYSSVQNVSIWAGTFNLNGRGNGVKEDLRAWLFPKINGLKAPAEIVVVGFQEIVELSPQQIMSTDPIRRQEWEMAVGRTLNDRARDQKSEEYILLRSGQLVGAALIVFVKAHVLKMIKNVEGSVKKTGMSGMAGNKGAVAIRMDYANTRLCFVTAHLAAGFSNYDERNRDYHTISHGLRFQRDRSIEDHDGIIWLGDFNYRIGLDDDRVRQLIEVDNLGELYQNDQLNLQMVAGRVFPFYLESRIKFLPTYKYNNGTDVYDTSEKARIPAWTDRILRKGENLQQVDYNTAPLRFSDHRPVYATFNCAITVIDESSRERLEREIFEKRQGSHGEINGIIPDRSSSDDDLLDNEPVAPGLPTASSDRQKWWLNQGLPARSTVAPPEKGYVPNPQRPSNPFTPTPQPDWIAPNRLQKQDGAQKRSPGPPVTPKLPRRTNTPALEASSTSAGKSDDDLRPVGADILRKASPARTVSSASKRPPPIPRKPAMLTSGSLHRVESASSTASRKQSIGGPPSSSSGLMDEDDDGAQTIPSLVPFRPSNPSRDSPR